jgi:hypothetical protein
MPRKRQTIEIVDPFASGARGPCNNRPALRSGFWDNPAKAGDCSPIMDGAALKQAATVLIVATIASTRRCPDADAPVSPPEGNRAGPAGLLTKSPGSNPSPPACHKSDAV